MHELLEPLCARKHLDRQQMRELFARIIGGHCSEIELTALLVALKSKGETPEEIAGAAEALREAAVPFDTAGREVGDSCGTGGDGHHTVNISTAVALVAAELGIPLAKHGNHSISSRSGSADVLERCGVAIDAEPGVARRCLEELDICFLYAPQYHSGVRHAMPVRRALGTRTIFNMLGPLVNPARPAWQVVGVYDPALCVPVARTLGLLGCKAALVVHGSGLDEIALHGPTTAALLRHGEVSALSIEPGELGLRSYPLEELRGGSPEDNAAWLKQLLAGNGRSSHVAIVALNAGALAWIADRADSLRDGLVIARETLATGCCAERLERWAQLSHAD